MITMSQLNVTEDSSDMSAGALVIRASKADLSCIRQAAAKYTVGDTLAVVQFPEDAGHACDGLLWETMKLRMSSQALRQTGSRKLKEMLEPSAQRRFRRRLRKMELPEDVRYVIDFTPQNDDEDCIDLFTSLCLPEKVQSWFLAGYYVGPEILAYGPKGMETKERLHADCSVGARLVLGHDDKCAKGPFCLLHKDIWHPSGRLEGVVHYEGDDVPLQFRIPELCPIRHRAAIIRLLLAVNGADLLISSAHRMWTMVWLAHHFDLTGLVRDAILTWFMAFPNTKFIEICPEESFRVARALELSDIARASFRILVNELAIDYAATETTAKKPRYTFSQRKRDIDFDSDAVEYAARKFAARIKTAYESLLEEDALGLLQLKQWRKLELIGQSITVTAASPNSNTSITKLVEAYINLVAALKTVFRETATKIPDLDAVGYHLAHLIEAQRDHYVPQKAQRGGDEDRQSIQEKYTSLTRDQKILTGPFWYKLMDSFEVYNDFKFWAVGGITLIKFTERFNACMTQAMRDNPITYDKSKLTITNSYRQDLSNYFSLQDFWTQLKVAIHRLCYSIMDRPNEHINASFVLSEHLVLGLNEEEMNYLPTWAGGLDDDTFGAFAADDVPETDMGPNQPGPAYHTGQTIADGCDDGTSAAGTWDTTRASDLAMSHLGLDDVTVAGSLDAQNSISTVLRRGRVALAPSEASESFVLEPEIYADARYSQPAQNQATGMTTPQTYEEDETGVEKGKSADDDEFDDGDGEDEDVDMFDDTSSTDTLSAFEL